MSKLIPVISSILFLSCNVNEHYKPMDAQIVDLVMDHHMLSINPCNYTHNHTLDFKNDSLLIPLLNSYPPFDNTPCIPTLSGYLLNKHLNLASTCYLVSFNIEIESIKNMSDDKLQLEFLNFIDVPIIHETNIVLDSLKMFKAGVNLAFDKSDCKRTYIYEHRLSKIFTNKKQDKAVIFVHIKGHDDYTVMHFFTKFNNKWH